MSDDLDSDPEAPAGGANPFSPTGAAGAAARMKAGSCKFLR